MTRSRIPPGPVMQEAYGILDKYKISRTFFVRTDQEGCALAASDINAANGITAESTVAEATGNEQKRKTLLGVNDLEQREETEHNHQDVAPSPVVDALTKTQGEEIDNKDINNNNTDDPTTEQDSSTTELDQSLQR